jgi:DNA-binding LytR/AlgR family response regulator
MEKRQAGGSLLYALERFDVGIIQLDRDLRVVSMNEYARRILPIDDKQPFDKVVTAFHPERAQQKIRFMLDQSECPVSNPPPMTMIINIPERVLLIKVNKMLDAEGAAAGYTFVFYDITEAVSTETAISTGDKRQLQKIPTVKQHRIVLVDTASVCYIRSEGHYTWVQTEQGSHFCNLSIGDLEDRLDPETFLRVHRSYIANLNKAGQILQAVGKVTLKLADRVGTELPVSRASVARLMAGLGLADPLLKSRAGPPPVAGRPRRATTRFPSPPARHPH